MELYFVFAFFIVGCLARPAEIASETNPKPCENRSQRRHKDGKCYLTNRKDPCKSNQKFYSLDDVIGVCDCQADLNLIYWPATDECYSRNTQGPCKKGEWLTFTNATVCNPLPDGCHDDGSYVYWSPNKEPNQCYKVGERGPCEENKKIFHKQGYITCADPKYSLDHTIPSTPCPKGSKRFINLCSKTHNFGRR